MVLATIHPIKQDWKPTGIKGDRYELYKNSDGILSVYLDGKQLPFQTNLSYHQKMDDVVTVDITIIFG